MPRRKKQQKTQEIYTQVIPVASSSDEAQVRRIMHLCGIERALTYNLLGALQGWGLNWRKAAPIVRTQLSPTDIGLPAKLWEWSVNDAMKAILAQQEAAKTFMIRAIYRRTLDEPSRSKLLDLMHNDPTSDPWLHRVFRTQYQRGHTFVRNQIVYQGGGYTCKRLTRNTVKLEVQGLKKGKRITLKLKCRHTVSGQIRLICNQDDKLSIVKSRKLRKEKATIQNFIRKDLRLLITSPTRIFAEDLTSPIKGKQQAKQINRKLNQWMKGELQASTLEDRIGDWINSVCGESSLYVANVFSYRDVIGSTGWGSFYLLHRGRNSSRQKCRNEHSASRR